MKYKTYYFRFKSPLHLGNHKPGVYERSETILHSDTITSAVLNAWATLGHVDWIEENNGDPGFTISSAFPFWENNSKKLHFFPRPYIPWNQEYDSKLSKKIKRIAWLDQEHFEKLINGRTMDISGDNAASLKSEFLTKHEFVGDLFTKETQDRVVISRNYDEVKDARPFVMERLRFNEKAGLFIIVKDDNDKLHTALEFLQYEGFGTDRSVGNGIFNLEEGDIEISVPQDSDLRTNLSLYAPVNREELDYILKDEALYSIMKRGGWITSPGNLSLEKNSVYMFGEGSVFPGKEIISGKSNLNLTPPVDQLTHPIYRCGRSIFIPVKLVS